MNKKILIGIGIALGGYLLFKVKKNRNTNSQLPTSETIDDSIFNEDIPAAEPVSQNKYAYDPYNQPTLPAKTAAQKLADKKAKQQAITNIKNNSNLSEREKEEKIIIASKRG